MNSRSFSQPSAVTEGTELPKDTQGSGRAVLPRVQPQDPALTSPLLENSLENCLPRDARLLGTEKPSKSAENTCLFSPVTFTMQFEVLTVPVYRGNQCIFTKKKAMASPQLLGLFSRV